MSRKLWLSTVTVVIALLAVFATSAVAKTAKTGAVGGTLNVDISTDVDYTDPALDYLSTGWEIEYSTCLKLMNYPDANGPKGCSARSRGSGRLPEGLEQREDLRLQRARQASRSSPTGQPVTAANFKAAIDRDADPKMQSPAVPFFSDIVGSDKSPVSGVKVKGSHLIITLTHAAPDFLARMAMPFFCAVPTNLAHDPNGVLAPAVGGPVLHLRSCPEQVDHDQEEPVLQGQAPAQRRTRSSTRSVTRWTRRTCASSRARPTTPPAVSRPRRTRKPLRSTGSTRASSGSSRRSASPTSR